MLAKVQELSKQRTLGPLKAHFADFVLSFGSQDIFDYFFI